jgi:16S rRNA (cytosine1402-N4)-methyltransferase
VQHHPVMVKEVLLYLNPRPGQTVVDCTVGEGGHAREILGRIGEEGMLIGLDKDNEILERTEAALGGRPNVRLMHKDFRFLSQALEEAGVKAADGLLFDLGISSYHLDNPSRGFSFMSDGPLDMRLNRTQEKTAADLVNQLPESELAEILWEYGEEPKSRRIAACIAKERGDRPITTTEGLKKTIIRATGARHGATHAATRTFQALRIAVNDELTSIHEAMRVLPHVLRSGGRAVVISFHSLEDRIVKRVLRDLASAGCAKNLTRKPVLPSKAEMESNPRSRSAKLRAMEAVEYPVTDRRDGR